MNFRGSKAIISGMLGCNFETRKGKLFSKSLFEMSQIEIWGNSRGETARYFRRPYSFCLNRPLSQMQRKRYLALSPNHYISWKIQVSESDLIYENLAFIPFALSLEQEQHTNTIRPQRQLFQSLSELMVRTILSLLQGQLAREQSNSPKRNIRVLSAHFLKASLPDC